MNRKLPAILIATTLLAGCAHPMVWDKPGATPADYNTDSYQCEKDARQSGYFGTGLIGDLNMQDFFKRCMVAHGWSLRGNASSQAPTALGGGKVMCKLTDSENMELMRDVCFARGGTVIPW